MIGGLIDYAMDPTGMNAYRRGLQQQEAAQRAELEAARGRAAGIGKEFTDTGEFVANTYAPYANLASLGAQGMSQDYSVTPNAYQFQGQVSDYLDPSIAYQQDQARRQLESSAAARGNLMSGAAAKAIADRAQSQSSGARSTAIHPSTERGSIRSSRIVRTRTSSTTRCNELSQRSTSYLHSDG